MQDGLCMPGDDTLFLSYCTPFEQYLWRKGRLLGIIAASSILYLQHADDR